MLIIYGCEVWAYNIPCETWNEIFEQIQKNFINYNFQIKYNTPYHMLLIEHKVLNLSMDNLLAPHD